MQNCYLNAMQQNIDGESLNLANKRRPLAGIAFSFLVAALIIFIPEAEAKKVDGWLNWRGPLQTGVSLEKNLPDSIEPDGESHLWSYPVKGGGTPVFADGRAYVFGYHEENDGKLVEETLLCLDADTGEKIWEYRSRDFLSDNIYNRYGIGSP
ncbi:MAG: PQQ-binding-like beta-propeller repeat protein, partial [Opitutales bacterium]|nr:PQQ-binding-like beta-propeller repeat protein [Opitutales bacterium]